jgi:hypothetical protein
MPIDEYDETDVPTVATERLAARLFSILDAAPEGTPPPHRVRKKDVEKFVSLAPLLAHWPLLEGNESPTRDDWATWWERIEAQEGGEKTLQFISKLIWDAKIDVSDLVQEAYLRTTHRSLTRSQNASHRASGAYAKDGGCCRRAGCIIA